jgi:tyrosyl-DNA phosphodiesterase-1
MLPLLPSSTTADMAETTAHPIGSGERFRVDLLRYFEAYGKRMDSLTKQLRNYDFSAVRAAFIGSAPSRQKPAAAKPLERTSFGWLGLQEILSSVPIVARSSKASPAHIVMQVSSIATLGAAPTWLRQFQSVLARSAVIRAKKTEPTAKSKEVNFFSKQESAMVKQEKPLPPIFNIIFPTPDEIRTSLDGYASGASIHTKLQSVQQQKQLEYLHPIFCHWKATSTTPNTSSNLQRQGQALRGPAAPHIKTYSRFSDEKHETIDWAMVTSANLSKQAWGDVVNKKDEIWIQSWEAGVVVWPELFEEQGGKETIMVPVFGRDMPDAEDVPVSRNVKEIDEDGDGEREANNEKNKTVVGFRMPYDLPLTPYTARDKPWCATMQYSEPDWTGGTWGGY